MRYETANAAGLEAFTKSLFGEGGITAKAALEIFERLENCAKYANI